MKVRQHPPRILSLLSNPAKAAELPTILGKCKKAARKGDYLHWDQLRHKTPPEGLSAEDWWLGTKMERMGAMHDVPLLSKEGTSFAFSLPESVLAELYEIDVGAGRSLGLPEPITNPQTKDQYLMRSLMEEAITSSQLEGAVTTREVAKELIRTGRPPRDTSERMILNNFVTMQHITELKAGPLTPERVFEIHRMVTDGTLDDPTAAGRFRHPGEHRVVADAYGEVFHEPPKAEELPWRLRAMCDFANGESPDYFVHPAIRAIILHFWLAYDHPFVDGNGRTARALFYWAMLHHGYWLFEFISISHILRQAPAQYSRSFLYTETDDNDLTYFIVAQARVIRAAIDALDVYLDRKSREQQELDLRVRALDLFNHRQGELIRHALKHPHHQYTIAAHQQSHRIVYQTARSDLLDLQRWGLLSRKRKGKLFVFQVPPDLEARLRGLEKQITPAP
ncbi:MAG: Fic family protein, partial [Opitutales bacterium]